MPTWAGGWHTLILVESKREVGRNGEEVDDPHPINYIANSSMSLDNNAYAVFVPPNLDTSFTALSEPPQPNIQAAFLHYIDVYVNNFIDLVGGGKTASTEIIYTIELTASSSPIRTAVPTSGNLIP